MKREKIEKIESKEISREISKEINQTESLICSLTTTLLEMLLYLPIAIMSVSWSKYAINSNYPPP